MALDPRKFVRRGLATALLGIAGYYAIFAGEYSTLDLRRLAVQQRVEATRLAETQRQVDSLRAVIDALDDDPQAIEKVARERFGMIRDGELLYRFVEVAPDSGPLARP